MVSIDSPRQRATAWTVIGAFGAVAAIPVVMLLPFRDVGWIADDFFFRHVTFRNAMAAWISGWGHNLAVGVPGYRPVPMATYALDHWIWAGAPSGYHLTNLLLYAGTTTALVLLTFSVTNRSGVAVLAGGLFALHPSHHETAVWVSGRPNMISTAFYLLSMAAYTRRRHILGVLAFGLALASYEAAVTLPFALLLVSRERPFFSRLRSIVPYVAAAALYLAFRWAVISGASTETSQLSGVHVGHFKLLAARLLCLPLVPTGFVWSSAFFWVTTIVSAAAGVLTLWTCDRSRWVSIARWVLFTALAFTPFLTQVGIADRFVLLASAGYCIGLALAFACVWDRPRRWERALGGALIATLVTAWAIDLYGRAGDWRAAGLLARRIVVETKALVPNPPAGARIEIFGVPGILGAAVVFPTYIDRALLDEYGRHDITVYWEADDDLVRRCQLQSDAAAGTFVVWWDSAKARMRADTERCPPSHAAHSPGSQGATEVGGRMTMLLSVSAALWRSISAIPQANDFPHGLFFSFGALVWLTLDAG